MAKIKNIELIDKSKSNDLVYADKNMIRTVVRNLTNNSIKFTNEGGKITYTSSSNKENTTVKITDTGIGMPSEKMRSLFKLDQISSTAGTAGETGTGLGLILCKEYIEKNQGDFKLKSVPGIGSTFIISLPNTAV